MANLSLNKVVLCGRLTSDPELKTTATGISVVSFTLAVNRPYRTTDANSNQPSADFISVVAWRQRAEFIARYFKKGSSICVIGSIQNRTWTDQQGQKRYATDIVADEVMFVDSRQESSGAPAAPQYTPDAYSAPSFSTPAASAPRFEEVKTDDDLPF